MFKTRLNRNILAAAFVTLFLYALAIAPANAVVRKELAVTGQSLKADCGPQGNSEFPPIRIAPAGTIPAQVPVGVPLNTGLNDRIG